ncbi:MAG TPA: ribonuclease Z [Solirubrobacteraceae bacterium]
MDLSILFCGTAGSVPTARRGLPGVLLRRGADRILFDCGEGTQRQLVRSGGLPDLDAIFFTHFHADHWLGLPGMLKSFALRERDKPLTIYGQPGTRDVLERVRFIFGRPPYPLTITELEPGEPVRRDDYVIEPFNVRHRVRAYGYAIVEDERPGRLDADRAIELGVSDGPDLGRLTRGEVVNGVKPEDVIGPPRAGRKIVLSGDTAPCDMLQIAAHRTDVLVHEATFVEEERERAAETGHSTARQAAETAAEADVGLLALVHLSGRYGGREVLDEALATFPRTVLPRDFDSIEVPFAEKGAPELVRFERPASAPAAGA